MVNRVQTIRYYTTLERPPTSEYSGELYINYADIQIGALDTSKSPVDFVAIRYHSQLALYVAGDFIVFNGSLYRCIQDTILGPFNGTRWSLIADLQEITVLIAIETQRAEAAEQALQNSINTEITNRIAGDTNLQNQINATNIAITSIFPPGVSMDYYGVNAPAGWLLEDGTVYNISQYPALGGLLGNRFGGNGTTTFATPPSLGRFGVTAGAGYPLGSMGGSTTATLNATNVPAHSHTIQPHVHPGSTLNPHTHTLINSPYGPTDVGGLSSSISLHGGGFITGAGGNSPVLLILSSETPGITIGPSGVLTTDPAGGTGGATAPITTLPPYISRTRIIKT